MNWIKTQIQKLFQARFTRKVTILAAGTAAGQAIMLLAAPVLTRLYGSTDFGVLAVFSSALGILSVLATLRYEEAIPLPRQDEAAFALLVLSLAILGAIALVVAAGVWLAGDETLALLKVSVLKPYLWLLPLALVGMGCYQTLNYWAVRKAAFHDIAATKIGQGGALALVQIVLGLVHKSPLGLVLGEFVGRVAGVGMLYKVLRRDRLNAALTCSWAALKSQARTYWKFPAFNLPNSLLNTLSANIPNLLLAAFFNPAAAGYYFLAIKVISAPLSLISKSVAQVFYQRAAEIFSLGQPLLGLVRQVHIKLFWIVSGPCLALMIFGPDLFAYIFGAEWRTAGEYMRYLIPWIATSYVVSPTAYVLTIVNKQETMLVFEATLLTGRVLALVLGAHYSPDPIWAIAAFGAVGFAAHLVMWRLVLAACVAPGRTRNIK